MTRDQRKAGQNYSNSLWQETDDSSLPPPAKIIEPNLAALFLATALENQRKCFARFRDIEDDIWLTYSWLETASNVVKLAKKLKNEFQIKAGDRVAILSNTPL